MAIEFTHVEDTKPVVEAMATTLQQHLQAGERVLWLLTGGSAMAVAVAVAQQLRAANVPVDKLSVSLIDERYGPVGHADSNWQQLADKGLDLPGATLLPVLDGQDLTGTAAAYDALLHKAFDTSDYRLGFFGIGPDGHIAGILPGSPALTASGNQLATGYDDSAISVKPMEGVKRGVARLTMTPAAVRRLNEVICLAMGASKRDAIQSLHSLPGGATADLPARLLNSVPKVTVYSDQF